MAKATAVVFCDLCGKGVNVLVGQSIFRCKACGGTICEGCSQKCINCGKVVCRHCLSSEKTCSISCTNVVINKRLQEEKQAEQRLQAWRAQRRVEDAEEARAKIRSQLGHNSSLLRKSALGIGAFVFWYLFTGLKFEIFSILIVIVFGISVLALIVNLIERASLNNRLAEEQRIIDNQGR
jgi:hypothetical protein